MFLIHFNDGVNSPLLEENKKSSNKSQAGDPRALEDKGSRSSRNWLGQQELCILMVVSTNPGSFAYKSVISGKLPNLTQLQFHL